MENWRVFVHWKKFSCRKKKLWFVGIPFSGWRDFTFSVLCSLAASYLLPCCFLDCLPSTLLSRSKWNRIPNRNGRTHWEKLLDTKIKLLAINSSLVPWLQPMPVSPCTCRALSIGLFKCFLFVHFISPFLFFLLTRSRALFLYFSLMYLFVSF